MKKHILKSISIVAAVIGLSGCADTYSPVLTDNSQGILQLSSLTIDTNDAEKVIQSSTSRAGADVNDFIVNISRQGSENALHSYRYGDMPEILALPAGDYTVNVESHQIQRAEWERPYYKGSLDFKITANEITKVEPVTANFSSLKVTVRFSDDLLALLGNDVKVTILANDEGLLEYTPGETRAGYFEVMDKSTTMVARFEGTLEGTFTTVNTPFIDVEPGQHRIITYKTKNGPVIPEPSGQIDPSGGIGIDAAVEIVDQDGNVHVEEDILDSSDRPGKEEIPDDPGTDPDPGPDEPGEERAATFEATDSPNLHLDGVNTASDTFGNAIVTITCPKGIKNLVVTINTDSDAFTTTLDDLGLAKPFDLAYPGDLEEQLGEEGLGLATGDKVIDQNVVLFNITQFVPLLNIYPGTHTFVITVTDSEGSTETLNLVFKS